MRVKLLRCYFKNCNIATGIYLNYEWIDTFLGKFCDIDIDSCIGHPCPQEGAICSDLTPWEEKILKRGYNCTCPEGFLTMEGQCLGQYFIMDCIHFIE